MRQWAFLIGLNNYQMFQPLNCAQQDAQVLQQFLIHQAGFAPEQCLLLTDTSPPISGRSTTPTRANLQSWIEFLTQHCFKPGDTLWFFFSGYGVCSKGRDYVVPLDGDPFAVETTCILMSDIFSRLQASLSPGLPLILLDINRSQGMFSSENVGMQTVHLAKQLGVPTTLSCQPGQFSREISSLGHGLFAIALQEALRYHQAATSATLMRFLGDRLSELGAYYYLPNQQPLSYCPAEKLHQPLIQAHFSDELNHDSNGHGNGSYHSPADDQAAQLAQISMAAGRTDSAVAISASPGHNPPSTQSAIASGNPVGSYGQVSGSYTNGLAGTVATPPSPQAMYSSGSQPPASLSPSALPPEPVSPATTANAFAASQTGNTTQIGSPLPLNPEVVEEASGSPLWRPILLWGGLLSLGLIGCVLWRNWPTILGPTPDPALVPSSQNSAIATSAGTAQLSNAAGVPSPSPEVSPAPVNPATDPVAAPSPASNRVLDFNPATPVAISGQAILENARNQVLSDQATPYRNAIDAAKQIPSKDAAYVAAQQEIAAWSQRILDIAQQRANQKQWEIAIMAAALVPEDDRKLYPQAQAAIAAWCPALQGQLSKEFAMQKAKEICSQKPI